MTGFLTSTVTTMTQRLILASNNAGKLKEFAQLLGPIGLDLHPRANSTSRKQKSRSAPSLKTRWPRRAMRRA